MRIDVVPNDVHGQLDVNALRDLIDDKVRLIAVTHVPTNSGLVNPAAAIGRVAREAAIPYLLDACQSVGQLAIDVQEIGCDFLSTTGRKYLRGPRGTGFLYVRHELLDRLEPPFIDMHAATWVAHDSYELRPDARRFEQWESNCAGKIGLGVAIDYALTLGAEAISARVRILAGRLRERLTTIPGVTLHDIGEQHCGIVTFTTRHISPHDLRERMRADGINIWLAGVSATRLDMEARHLEVVARASLHYYNTDDEIETFCRRLESLESG